MRHDGDLICRGCYQALFGGLRHWIDAAFQFSNSSYSHAALPSPGRRVSG